MYIEMHGHIFFVVINIFVVQDTRLAFVQDPFRGSGSYKTKEKPNQVVYALRKELYMFAM